MSLLKFHPPTKEFDNQEFSLKEAMVYMGCSYPTIIRKVYSGQLKVARKDTEKKGKPYIIKGQAIREYWENKLKGL